MRTERTATHGERQRGSALLLTLGFMLIAGVCVTSILLAVQRQTRNVYRAAVHNNSVAGANAILTGMSADMLFIANNRPPQMGGLLSTMGTVMRQIQPNSPAGYETLLHNSRPLSYVRDLGPNDLAYRVIPNDPPNKWSGYSTSRLQYELVASTRENTENARRLNHPGVTLTKELTIDFIPLYQFAIFYDQDMELHPGPQMDVRGPVHGNRNLWLSANTGLNFHSSVSAAGQIRSYSDFTLSNSSASNYTNLGVRNVRTNNVAPDNTMYQYMLEPITQTGPVQFVSSGSSMIDMRGTSTADTFGSGYDTNGNGFLDSMDSSWVTNAISRWRSNVRDGQLGARTINPPLPTGANSHDLIERISASDSAALAAEKFESKADVLIVGNPGQPNTIQVRVRSGSTWTTIPNRNDAGTTIVTVGTFYDGQQDTVVRTLDVNMTALRSTSGIVWERGGLYVSTTPGPGDTFSSPTSWGGRGSADFMPAVRLTNAGTLPTNSRNGFMFATDRPLYTVGDINTASTRATAVIAADSMTITSQNLVLREPLRNADGSIRRLNAQGQVVATGGTIQYNIADNAPGRTQEPIESLPVADGAWRVGPASSRATTTNAIFVMGNTPSKFVDDPNNPGRKIRVTQSGGAHNVFRYLETWGHGHTFNGSMIVLYASEVANADWFNQGRGSYRTGGYYGPPTRNYNWDSTLRDREPPPGMPVVIDIQESSTARSSVEYAKTHQPGA